MTYSGTDCRRASRVSRFVFAAGLVVLVPGTGLTLRAHSSVKDDADVAAATASAKTAAVTLRGVVREKRTGRPVAGARISVTAVTDEAAHSSSSAVTDEAGRYTITDLPKSRRYGVIALPKRGEPYLITSRNVEATKDAGPIMADLEFVRGIPFRVRVLDEKTGKPLKGASPIFRSVRTTPSSVE